MPIKYRPLKHSKNEIRLLHCLGMHDNRPSFELCHFPLGETPPYWALSYVWGEQRSTRTILVDGEIVEVTRNLFHALMMYAWHMKGPMQRGEITDGPIYLWADAICINQNDSQEKVHQIRFMPHIYENKSVSVHMGNGDRQTDDVAWKALYGVIKRIKKGRKPKISANSWPAVAKFFSKPWLFRIWTVQEFIAGLKPTDGLWDIQRNYSVLLPYLEKLPSLLLSTSVPFQSTKVAFAAFAISTIRSIPLKTDVVSTMMEGIRQYMILHKICSSMQKCSPSNLLLGLLWAFRDRSATDRRDKVYALLGVYGIAQISNGISEITPPEEYFGAEKLIINYDAKLEDVYTSLVRAMVNDTQSLNIICATQGRNDYFERSWVPDWSEPWSRVSLLTENIPLIGNSDKKEQWHASGLQKALVTFSEDSKILTAKGLIWSRIADMLMLPSRGGKGYLFNLFESFGRLSEDLRHKAEACYGEVEDKDQPGGMDYAFFLTMCGGRFDLDPMQIGGTKAFVKGFYKDIVDESSEGEDGMDEDEQDDSNNDSIDEDEQDDDSDNCMDEEETEDDHGDEGDREDDNHKADQDLEDDNHDDDSEEDDREADDHEVHERQGSKRGKEDEEESQYDEGADDQMKEDTGTEDKGAEETTKHPLGWVYQDSDFDARAAQMGQGRRSIVSESGHFGLVPDHARVGDLICVLYGCDVPVILRKFECHYKFIGESYVHGIMHGEAIEALQKGEVQEQQFNLH